MIISSLLFILASGFCYAMLTGRRFENFVFPALAADVLILFFFAVFHALPQGLLTVFCGKAVLLTGTLLFLLRKRRHCMVADFKNLCCTPGLFFLVFGVILVYFLTKGRVFTAWDEFSWWGTSIKSTFANDAIPLITGKIQSRYLNYPPVNQLWSYLFLKVFAVGYQESCCYFAADLSAVVMFSTFYRKADWKNPFPNLAMGVTLFVFCFFLSSRFYSCLQVDLLLGVAFGVAMFMQMDTRYDGIDALLLLTVCAFLLLIKRSGALLTGLVLIVPVIYAVK